MFLIRLFLWVYLFLLSLSFANAQELPARLEKESLLTEHVFDLGKIAVAKDKDAAKLPSTSQISMQDIEIRNAQTVDAAMDFVGGVRVTLGQKNEPYLMIRGFAQDKTLILLDGIPIASPYYGYVDLNQVPLENVAEIEVIKGPASVLYGANTMGGIVNIVSKRPGREPHLELNSGIANNATRYFTLNYAAPFKEDLYLCLSGAHRRSNGFDLSKKFVTQRNEDGNRRENSFYEKDSISLKLGWEKERYSLSAFFNYFDNEKGIPPDVFANRPRYWRFGEWKRWMAALAGETEISDNLSLAGRVFYDKYDNTLQSYDDASYTTQANASSWTSIYDEYAIGSNIYFYYRPQNMHFFKGAINLKKDVHREQDDSDQPWQTFVICTHSFGLEDKMQLNNKLSLLVGISCDLLRQRKTTLARKGDNIVTFNPLALVNFDLTPQTQFYASLSKRTRFPTINQLYSQSSGNPDLNEQRNINGEVGVTHHFEKMVIELSYFYNRVTDLIERSSRNDPYLNISRAIFEGAEVNINTKIGEYFSTRLSYTHLNARNKNPEILGRTEKELAYVPDHKTDIELRYQNNFGLSCALLGAYNGRRYYYGNNNLQHTLGGYFVWNIRMAQEFGKHWQGIIFIENILDRNYEEEEGYPQPGRTFLVSLKMVF